jgi:hypothetical protein
MAAVGQPDANAQICSIGRVNIAERTCGPDRAHVDCRWMPANESRLLDAFMADVNVGHLLRPERRCLRNEYFAPEQHEVIELGPAHLLPLQLGAYCSNLWVILDFNAEPVEERKCWC